MTPRERDPQVWAAAYGAMFVNDVARLTDAADGNGQEKHQRALEQATRFAPVYALTADAAVMALHPDGTTCASNGVVLTVSTDERVPR